MNGLQKLDDMRHRLAKLYTERDQERYARMCREAALTKQVDALAKEVLTLGKKVEGSGFVLPPLVK